MRKNKVTFKIWLKRLGWTALIMLCSMAIGLGYSCFHISQRMSLENWDVCSMAAKGESIFLGLSNGNKNLMAHVDYKGRLLNYVVTDIKSEYRGFAVDGDTIYAILSVSKQGENIQSLVSLSMNNANMRSKKLAELTGLKSVPAGVEWKNVCLSGVGNGSNGVYVLGTDQSGQAYVLGVDPETGTVKLTKVFENENVLELKLVNEGHYVWISRSGSMCQEVNGVIKGDLFKYKTKAPYQISLCDSRCFVADSISGDIYEIIEDGSVALLHAGNDKIGPSDYEYWQLRLVTVYPDKSGTARAIGICTMENGNNAVVGESCLVDSMVLGRLRFLIFWSSGWRVSCIVFLTLVVVIWVLRLVLCSPRLVVRISACEIVVALVLTSSMAFVQYCSYQKTLKENVAGKLRLLGENIAASVEAGANDNFKERLDAGLSRNGSGEEYSVLVIWDSPEGPVVDYGSDVPDGCRVEDVKSPDFLRKLQSGIEDGGGVSLANDAGGNDYMYTTPVSQGERKGCVVVSQSAEEALAESGGKHMLIVIVAYPLLFTALILMTQWLLSPLKSIHEALEEFARYGGGNRVELWHMPKTELYEISRVFNQLSVQTKVQMNELSNINGAYSRFVPKCFLKLLGKRNVLEIKPGERRKIDGHLLMLFPETPLDDASKLEEFFNSACSEVQDCGGMPVDYDERLGAVTFVFTKPQKIISCAVKAFDSISNIKVMAAVITEPIEFGAFGSEKLLYPLAVSSKLYRRLEVLSLLNSFDVVLVQNGKPEGKSRLLGWDDEVSYYEDTAFRPGEWQAQWHGVEELWEHAMEDFKERHFAEAMRKFAKVLRSLPGDKAAKWYLFRCQSLRDSDGNDPDTDLLFNWRDGYG